jgi:hypothetical protein
MNLRLHQTCLGTPMSGINDAKYHMETSSGESRGEAVDGVDTGNIKTYHISNYQIWIVANQCWTVQLEPTAAIKIICTNQRGSHMGEQGRQPQ